MDAFVQSVITMAQWVIVAGYWLLAIKTGLFGLAGRAWSVRLAGTGFFVLCGLTHAHLAYHVSVGDDIPYTELTGIFGIHFVLQALAVWGFIYALSPESQSRVSGMRRRRPSDDR